MGDIEFDGKLDWGKPIDSVTKKETYALNLVGTIFYNCLGRFKIGSAASRKNLGWPWSLGVREKKGLRAKRPENFFHHSLLP